MKSITDTEAEKSFRTVLDASRKEPVSITRDGRPEAVLMSQGQFDRLVQSKTDENKPHSILDFLPKQPGTRDTDAQERVRALRAEWLA